MILLMTGGLCQADVVRLQQGGEVRGEIVTLAHEDDPSHPISVKTPSGILITLSVDEVEFVEHRSPDVEEYVTRSRLVPDTVDSHWELAEWCKEQRLAEPRREQLELLLDLDPEHADARRILGYVKNLGHWIKRDDLMLQRGYVQHRGKWITRQELELLTKSEQQRSAELAWYKDVKIWVDWLTGDHAPRREIATGNLLAIHDSSAVPALRKFMSDNSVAGVRMLYLRILGQLAGPEPIAALVDQYLLDVQSDVSSAALQILQIGPRGAQALPALINALHHESNSVVLRAGTALGLLGDQSVVPALIDALVTTHSHKVEVAVGNPLSFAQTADGNVGMVNPAAVSRTVPLGVEMAARAGQYPYGVQVLPSPTSIQRTRVVTVRTEYKNATVLAALQKLTEQDFGFNERNWHLWWSVRNT